MLDLGAIKDRLAAAPELHPYATAPGGVVLLNGPFPYAKAHAAVELAKHAPTDLAALIAEVERLRALSALIAQIEARGWLWDCGQLPPNDERGRYYMRIRASPRGAGNQHYGYGFGATPEAATQQAFDALSSDLHGGKDGAD